MSKNVVEIEGPQVTSQYGAYALRAELARLHTRMRLHTPTRPRPGTHTHARASMHTRARAHRYVTLTAFPHQQWFHKSASVLRFIHTLPVLFFLSYLNNYAHFLSGLSKDTKNVAYRFGP